MRKLLLLTACLASLGWAQQPMTRHVDQSDAEQTKRELNDLLRRYPPTLRDVLALDPSLLSNQGYLATYPAVMSFLNAHPDIAHNPAFFVPGPEAHSEQPGDQNARYRREMFSIAATLIGFAVALSLIAWLTRTLLDYRRWNRLTRVQTDVHTKLLDRFTANDELMEYVKSPAGAKFLESSPIALDAAPRGLAAPLGRILLSVQAGLVVVAAGGGMLFVSARVDEDIARLVYALGVLGIAVGGGLVISAAVSFFISHKMGLLERTQPQRVEPSGNIV